MSHAGAASAAVWGVTFAAELLLARVRPATTLADVVADLRRAREERTSAPFLQALEEVERAIAP